MLKLRACSYLIVVSAMTLPTVGWARSSVDARLSRLESLVENEKNYALLNQIEAMAQEIRELRGTIEEQHNELRLLKQKQEKLFLNLDSRLNAVAGGVATGITSGAAGAVVGKEVVAPVAVMPVLPKSQDDAQSSSQTATTVAPMDEFAQKSEKSMYDVAYQTMQAKQYVVALEQFKELLRVYPEGTYTPNAYYWLGEIYLVQWQQAQRLDESLLQLAQEAFRTVQSKFTKHQKGEDALLKLGLIEIELHHWIVARDILTKVINNNPGSSRARLAESRIARMQQQGHL